MTDNYLKIYPVSVPTSLELRTYNFYLVELHRKLFLIDAGINTEKCWQTLLDTLHDHHFSVQDIEEIIITHSHIDHIGLIQRIMQENAHVKLYAYETSSYRLKREPSFLEKRIDFFDTLYSEMGCGAKGKSHIHTLKTKMTTNSAQAIPGTIHSLKDGDCINGLKVIYTPGHWPDHIVLFHEKSGTLFAGDLLVQHISTNALIEPDAQGNRLKTLVQHEESHRKMLQYRIQLAYSGHGNVISNPTELIEKRLAGMERKSNRILKVLQELTQCHAADIAMQMYPHKYDSEFQLVMSEIIGHLDRLEALGKIVKTKEYNKWIYRLAYT